MKEKQVTCGGLTYNVGGMIHGFSSLRVTRLWYCVPGFFVAREEL